MLQSLKTAYLGDPLLGVDAKRPRYLAKFEGLWYWRDRLYVPPSLRDPVLRQLHATPAAGHWGVMKTLDLLLWSFSWQGVRADVLRFVAGCESCQRVKVIHQPPQGELKLLPIPDRPWSTIGVDFVVKLAKCNGFDAILVVVDHYTKLAHFIPAKECWTAHQLAEAFISGVF